MFQHARLKLTGWYLLIIMLISMSFSFIIYKVLTLEVERFAHRQRFRIEQKLQNNNFSPSDKFQSYHALPAIDPDLVNETKNRILLILAIINLGILTASGGLSYFLAGKTLKPIKEMIDEQSQFISDASHELRTPLTSLKSAMEVYLRDKNLSLKDAKTLVAESIIEVNKLQSLSEELLQLSQYQKAKGNLKFEMVSLLAIIKAAIAKIEPLAKQKQITIKNSAGNQQIEGNKYGLGDLLVILLDNAVKYSFKAGVVVIYTKRTNNSILILVKDQGIGINEKDLPHIFDRFYRADSARAKTSAGGYGLGLSIAKKIVDIHKGSINVESSVKKACLRRQGTTFTIRLPIKQSFRIAKSSFFS